MSFRKVILVLIAALLCMACSTQGKFKIPSGTQLEIHDRPVTLQNQTAVTSPFFWTATGGIKYRLLRNGSPVKTGKLSPKFRVVSIFWPPFALIYWPMGLNPDTTYDLIRATPGQMVR